MLERLVINSIITMKIKIIDVLTHVNDDIVQADNDRFRINISEQVDHSR